MIREAPDPGGRRGPARPRPERRGLRRAASGWPGEVEAADATRDPTPLREALKPLARLHERIAAHETLDATIRRETALLRNQAGRLSPSVADLAALVRTPLPGPDTVARYRQRSSTARPASTRAAADRRDTALRQVAATRDAAARARGRPADRHPGAARGGAGDPRRRLRAPAGRPGGRPRAAPSPRSRPTSARMLERTASPTNGPPTPPGSRPTRPTSSAWPPRRRERPPRPSHPRRDRRRDRRGRGGVARGVAAGRASCPVRRPRWRHGSPKWRT